MSFGRRLAFGQARPGHRGLVDQNDWKQVRAGSREFDVNGALDGICCRNEGGEGDL